MSFGQIIKGTILPKVPLKTLFEEDSSANSKEWAEYKAPEYLPDNAQKVGANSPFVKIAGQIVDPIESMIIDETGFLPKITITFTDTLGEFAGDYFPKANIIMNVYLKSPSEKFKPVRCDFLIKSVKSIPAEYTGNKIGIGIGTTYIVNGELYIPGAYNNVSKSYVNMSSKDALKAICTELGLGFAENESSPSDAMNWININMSTLDFMKKIVSRSYQDDDSFFIGFIDKYYYFNFIEVNRQLKIEDPQNTFYAAANPLTPDFNQKSKDSSNSSQINEDTVINYLTTELDAGLQSNYITELNIISNQGEILKNDGYKKNIYYYDHLLEVETPDKKFKDFFMEPLKSIDRDQEFYLVPEEKTLVDGLNKKWMGIDYGNNHPQWNAARLLNFHNIKELEKIKLKVTLKNINFQMLRGFTAPVLVSIQKAESLLKSTQRLQDQQIVDDGAALSDSVPDIQLTGYYYVSGAKYIYDRLHRNGLYTELFLARREWHPSKKTS